MDERHHLYSVPEAAVQLSVGRSMVYELLKSGELERVKIGRRSLVLASSIESYINRLRSEQGGATDLASESGR